jgi:hypothetical protein
MDVETTTRLHWQHEVVVLDDLILEVDLPGGRDAVRFARQVREETPSALRVMLGEGQMSSLIEAQRNPNTRRISRKAVTGAIERLFAALPESLPTLFGALEFEAALRASLRAEYGVDLRDPGMSLADLADLVRWLPQGCALYRATGGPMAWTDEEYLLARVEMGVRVLAWQRTKDGTSGRNQPKPLEPPQSVHEQQAEQREQSRRAQAYLKRTGQA